MWTGYASWHYARWAFASGPEHSKRPPTATAGFLIYVPQVLWRTGVAAENALAMYRRLRPDARKLGQGPFLFFGCGLADPT
jgi:hypothetical protein